MNIFKAVLTVVGGLFGLAVQSSFSSLGASHRLLEDIDRVDVFLCRTGNLDSARSANKSFTAPGLISSRPAFPGSLSLRWPRIKIEK